MVLITFRQACDLHGYTASTVADNGAVCTPGSPASDQFHHVGSAEPTREPT